MALPFNRCLTITLVILALGIPEYARGPAFESRLGPAFLRPLYRMALFS